MSLHSNTAKRTISGVAKCDAQRLFVTGERRVNVFMIKNTIELLLRHNSFRRKRKIFVP